MEIKRELLRQINKSERKNILCGISYLSKCGSQVATQMLGELKKLKYGRKEDKILYIPAQKQLSLNIPKEKIIYMLYGNVNECVKYAKVLRKQDSRSSIQINIVSKPNSVEIAILKQFRIAIKYVNDIYQAFAKLSLLPPHKDTRITAVFLPGLKCNKELVTSVLLSMTKNQAIVDKLENNYKSVNVLLHLFAGQAQMIYQSPRKKYTISTFGDKIACQCYLKEFYQGINQNETIVLVGHTALNEYLSLSMPNSVVINKEEINTYIKDNAIIFFDLDYIFEDIVAAFEALNINSNISIFIYAADYEAVLELVKPILEEQGGKRIYSYGDFERIYASFFKQ